MYSFCGHILILSIIVAIATLELFLLYIFLLDSLNDLKDLNDDNYFKDDSPLYEDNPNDMSAMDRIYKTSKQALGNKLQETLHVIVLKLSNQFLYKDNIRYLHSLSTDEIA